MNDLVPTKPNENTALAEIKAKLAEKKFDPLERLIEIADDMNLPGDIDAQKVALAATKEVQRMVEKASDNSKNKGKGNINVLIPIGFNPDGSMNFEIKESHSSEKLNGNK